MNRLSLLLAVLLGAGTVFAADPKPAAPAAAASFDAFRLIGDRNIFNPNRTGRRERTAEEQAPRVDTISLVGTMDSDKGVYAFFDSPDSAYRKALHVGESVGPFKVLKIAADVVDLERDGQTLSLHLAQQLRRPEGGDWTLIGADLARSEVRATETARTAEAGAAPAIPADASETLRRLMEQRQKQLKQ